FKDYDECIVKLEGIFKKIRKEACDQQEKVREKTQSEDPLGRPTEGSFVWLKPVGKRKGKLQRRRRGPCQVKSLRPNFLVELSFLNEDKTLIVHQSRLCSVEGHHSFEEMKEIAAQGEGEFFVDEILKHRGKRKRDLEFL
ncbi:hypothetical protein ADUPG1_004193, partial [Aduncisulcus paluster]